MIEIACTIIAAAATVLAAMTERRNRVSAKKTEARMARRERESHLSMDLMVANCALSVIIAKKLNGMHTNGDVEEAMDAAKAAREAYIDFVRDEAAHNISKI